MMQQLSGTIVARPLDATSAAILDVLTAGFAEPGDYGLYGREFGSAAHGAPSVAVERLDRCRYLVTRYVELPGVRTVDPEVDDRVADPEIEFLVHAGGWYPVAATVRQGDDGGDLRELAAAMLRAIAREHRLRVGLRAFLRGVVASWRRGSDGEVG